MDKKQKQSQAEKSREMRARLFKATLDCIEEYGYQGASITKILQKADVSKGAWSHHFKNKTELVANATNHMLQESLAHAKNMLPRLIESSANESIYRVLLNFLWDTAIKGSHQNVLLEVYLASRTDKELQQSLAPVTDALFKSLGKIWSRHFKAAEGSAIPIDIILNLTLLTIRGMSVMAILKDDPVYHTTFKDEWLTVLKRFVVLK